MDDRKSEAMGGDLYEVDHDARAKEEAERLAVLTNLATVIAAKRKEAIDGRAISGIEQEWIEDDEHYQSIDDANRREVKSKPISDAGSSSARTRKAEETPRSTAFVNITRPYTDAASARVCDMLLPTDDRNWDMGPTVIPELVKQLKDERIIADENTGKPMMKPSVDPDGRPLMQPVMAGEQQMMDANGQPMMQPIQEPKRVRDLVQEVMDQARAAADKARDQIDDWLGECQYHAEVRMVIEDTSRIGTGVLKGPEPVKQKRKAVLRGEGGSYSLQIHEVTQPASRRVDVWNLFPDPSCGESIHNGSFLFERDDITTRRLMDLKGTLGPEGEPLYLEAEIDECLKEGPIDVNTGIRRLKPGDKLSEKDKFEIWYFHGMVSRKDLESAGCSCGETDPESDAEIEQYPAILTMVNNRIIKAAMSPLDSMEFPYDVMVWQRRAGHWAGIGVARQMHTAQRGLNAAVRNLLDNAGLSAGPQVVVNRSKITPADGKWALTPRKIWYTIEDEDLSNVKDAFQVYQITSLQAELMAIIQFFQKIAEDVTGLPMLIQGQQGRAPDTVGGMTMLNNNANSVLRRIARTFDDRITVPHIGRYYEWLMIHGEDDAAKGDFNIEARGSSALIERDMQQQFLIQMLGISQNPAYGMDPEKVAQEVLKSQRLDPKRLEMDEEKKKKIQQAPADPRIVVAQLGAQEKEKDRAADAQKFQAEKVFESEQNHLDRALKQWEKEIDAKLNAADMAGEESMSLNDIKAMLSSTAMKLRTQKELAAVRGPQVATPATEPPGRAPNGMAFAK